MEVHIQTAERSEEDRHAIIYLNIMLRRLALLWV